MTMNKIGFFFLLHSLTQEGRTMKPHRRRSNRGQKPADLSSRQRYSGWTIPPRPWHTMGGQQWMEAEGNSQHAIIKPEPPILVRKATRYRRAPPRIHRFQCQRVISEGQLEIINLWVRNLYPVSYFCGTALTFTLHSYQKSLLKREDTVILIERRRYFLLSYIFNC